jgi:hypothetical protein
LNVTLPDFDFSWDHHCSGARGCSIGVGGAIGVCGAIGVVGVIGAIGVGGEQAHGLQPVGFGQPNHSHSFRSAGTSK